MRMGWEKMKRYKICVYAICKNEVQFVERWVNSMSEADLIVVTDTGSTDGTVELLRDLGVTVYTDHVTPWRFDVARNKSLSHVPEDVDICVCTDLDEVFVSGWRDALERAWFDGAHQGRYLYNWSVNEDGTPNVQFSYFKVHTRQNFKWVYPIHEVTRYIGTDPMVEVFIEGMVLNHYPDSTKSRGSYLKLLELAVEENSEDDRMVYYLGREYFYKGRFEDCIKTLKKHLTLKSATWLEERCASMRWIAQCYENLGQVSNAYNWYFKAIAECPFMREPYVEFAKYAYLQQDWPVVYYMAQSALNISEKSQCYINMGYAWDYTPDDLLAISSYYLGMYDLSLKHAEIALKYAPDDERLFNNYKLIKDKINEEPVLKGSEELIHTLLLLFREEYLAEDKELARICLHSLENASYKTVVIYNQGCLSNQELNLFLKEFDLHCIVIGTGENVGTSKGRQSCFEFVWEKYPRVKYISELHLDMIFKAHWEDELVDFLQSHDEPMISCGIVDKEGQMAFLNKQVLMSENQFKNFEDFLTSLECDEIVSGFTNPCIHVSEILKKVGGYQTDFLRGRQCFEDDSLLLGYYYYYGTSINWYPKVNYRSVVYHAVAGQRLQLSDNVMINYNGLVKQYGAMGLKHLSELHTSSWQVNYFQEQFEQMKREL